MTRIRRANYITYWGPRDLREVAGLVLGEFGVHRDASGDWHVTHLPWGMRVGSKLEAPRSERAARAVLRDLEADIGDFADFMRLGRAKCAARGQTLDEHMRACGFEQLNRGAK